MEHEGVKLSPESKSFSVVSLSLHMDVGENRFHKLMDTGRRESLWKEENG